MTRYVYPGVVIEVHDGDTVKIDLDLRVRTRLRDQDLGFNIRVEGGRLIFRLDARLAGLNAAELATAAGKKAQQALVAKMPLGSKVIVHSQKPAAPLGVDKWGDRWDAEIELADHTNINQWLIDNGYAAPWDGTGAKPVPA